MLNDDKPNQPTKSITKNWFEISDESQGTYNNYSDDYSDVYILVKGNKTVEKGTTAAPNNPNKKVIFKNIAPFTICISRMNNTQVDDAQYIDVVMRMYNLLEYSDNYSKTSRILWQYCRDEPAINAADGEIADFTEANAITDSFK